MPGRGGQSSASHGVLEQRLLTGGAEGLRLRLLFFAASAALWLCCCGLLLWLGLEGTGVGRVRLLGCRAFLACAFPACHDAGGGN